MFDNMMKFFNKFSKDKEAKKDSKIAAKERLQLVLMQDRASVSADFMELMKQEIIEVIKKYIDVDENAIDVRLTNKQNADGTTGAPMLYANIPILNVKDDTKHLNVERKKEEASKEKKAEKKIENVEKTENKENKENIKEEVSKNEEKNKKEQIDINKESKEVKEQNNKDKAKKETNINKEVKTKKSKEKAVKNN